MQELAQLIASDSFQKAQQEFFTKNCETFDHEEENKLQYTEIHKNYETMVEAQMAEKLGIEKLTKIGEGIGEYIKESGQSAVQTKEVFDAIEVLTSLSDFNEFKQVMLAKKEEMAADGGGDMKIINAGVLDVAEHMDRIEALAKDSDTDDWNQLLDFEGLGAWSRKSEDGSTILRVQIQIDMKPRECFEMLTCISKERSSWQPEMNNVDVLEEFGQGD